MSPAGTTTVQMFALAAARKTFGERCAANASKSRTGWQVALNGFRTFPSIFMMPTMRSASTHPLFLRRRKTLSDSLLAKLCWTPFRSTARFPIMIWGKKWLDRGVIAHDGDVSQTHASLAPGRSLQWSFADTPSAWHDQTWTRRYVRPHRRLVEVHAQHDLILHAVLHQVVPPLPDSCDLAARSQYSNFRHKIKRELSLRISEMSKKNGPKKGPLFGPWLQKD